MAESIIVRKPMDWTLVWENEDTSTDFAAQTISLDLSTYIRVKIEIIAHNSDTETQLIYPEFVIEEDPLWQRVSCPNGYIRGHNGTNLYMWTRDIRALPIGVEFGDAYSKRVNATTKASIVTITIVPRRIWAR